MTYYLVCTYTCSKDKHVILGYQLMVHHLHSSKFMSQQLHGLPQQNNCTLNIKHIDKKGQVVHTEKNLLGIVVGPLNPLLIY